MAKRPSPPQPAPPPGPASPPVDQERGTRSTPNATAAGTAPAAEVVEPALRSQPSALRWLSSILEAALSAGVSWARLEFSGRGVSSRRCASNAAPHVGQASNAALHALPSNDAVRYQDGDEDSSGSSSSEVRAPPAGRDPNAAPSTESALNAAPPAGHDLSSAPSARQALNAALPAGHNPNAALPAGHNPNAAPQAGQASDAALHALPSNDAVRYQDGDEDSSGSSSEIVENDEQERKLHRDYVRKVRSWKKKGYTVCLGCHLKGIEKEIIANNDKIIQHCKHIHKTAGFMCKKRGCLARGKTKHDIGLHEVQCRLSHPR